jgi:hypothetical protein
LAPAPETTEQILAPELLRSRLKHSCVPHLKVCWLNSSAENSKGGLLKNLFFMALIIFAAGTSHAENRISGPADKAQRCTANPVATACTGLNQAEVDKSCITPEERDTLNGYGAFANCVDINVKGEKLRVLSGWCACGCFSLSTQIAVADKVTGLQGQMSAFNVMKSRKNLNLITLAETYQFGELFSYQQTPIALTATGAEKKMLLKIETELGHAIEVTQNHPLVRGDFKMIPATLLKVGDELVDEKGAHLKILKISKVKSRGPVINFVTTAATDLGHILFAEGLASGDMKWQAMLSDEAKAIEARK